MKSKLILVWIAIAISIPLLACSAAPTTAPAAEQLSVDASYSGKQVEVAVGQSLVVTLESNPSTGFKWDLAGITDQAVLEKVSNEFKAAEAKSGEPLLVGAPGKEIWTFKALKKGKSEISLEYRRPWESGVQPAQTFTLNVVVE